MINNSLDNRFAVIGAGPYGLAVASHLRAIGAEVRIFGKPMDFWDTQMPKGMMLRSPWLGSNIGDPNRALTLDRYESALGSKMDRGRVHLDDFVRYGQWFQKQALPDLDQRNVSTVEHDGTSYRMTLEDGESFHSPNVVVAAGIGSFSSCPALFASLPEDLVSHASHRANQNLSRFAGKRVIVVGAGQSAIESAALLHEGGAEVEVLIRQPKLRWLKPRWPKLRPVIDFLLDSKMNPLNAPARIGSSSIGWLVERPALVTMMPRKHQDMLYRAAVLPAASSWLEPRTQGVTFSPSRHTVNAAARGGKVHLQLNDGGERTVDHVLLGTGYKVDIKRYGFLSRELLQGVQTIQGYPVLNRGFESSLPGLYFVGAPATYSFGPFLRFVVGSQYAAQALSRYTLRAPATRTFQNLQRTPAARP
ncbi:MAG: NAD(P)-binding domain-containing protein [Acidobacteriota bacterium]